MLLIGLVFHLGGHVTGSCRPIRFTHTPWPVFDYTAPALLSRENTPLPVFSTDIQTWWSAYVWDVHSGHQELCEAGGRHGEADPGAEPE